MRNDILVFSGRSHPLLADAVCRELRVPLARSSVVRFSNENLMVQIEENVREADVFVIQTSAPPVNEFLVETLIYIDALKRASARRVTAVIPYFPYVRSDKKDKPRISITARLMADLLEAAGADRVLTMDLHSPQIQGFFKIPVDNLSSLPLLTDHVARNWSLDNAVVVATDAGSAKSAGVFASRMKLDLAIIDKRRYADDEKARAEALIGEVEGRDAFLFDDEIASGGTILEAAAFLASRGARRVVAGATHGVFTRDSCARLDASRIEQVIVTDTIPIPAAKRFERMRELTVAPLFAQAIAAIHEGRSISALF